MFFTFDRFLKKWLYLLKQHFIHFSKAQSLGSTTANLSGIAVISTPKERSDDCAVLEYPSALRAHIHLLGSGQFVFKKKKNSYYPPRFQKSVYLTGNRESCTFRMIITSQWIFVTPCSLADRGVITLDRQQMFCRLSHSRLKFPLLSHKYDLSSKGTAGVDIFSSVLLINWHRERTLQSADGEEKRRGKAEVSDLQRSLTVI